MIVLALFRSMTQLFKSTITALISDFRPLTSLDALPMPPKRRWLCVGRRGPDRVRSHRVCLHLPPRCTLCRRALPHSELATRLDRQTPTDCCPYRSLGPGRGPDFTSAPTNFGEHRF